MHVEASGRVRPVIVAITLLISGGASAQTRVVAPANKYSAAEDVRIGRQAAAQAERQLPLLHDPAVTSYVAGIGRRLVAGLPPTMRHRGFGYSFKVVNQPDINAFALPGGPMYVNRGMLEAARNEGEVAGVMAHELAHVALRHATAQAGKASPYALGTIGGQILGAIIGGRVGSVVAEGTRVGLGAAFMRFSREYERQADLAGAQIMARAGYDPRDLANMFRTIEQRGGGSGPEWLSDHPNPGNRYAAIQREATLLRVRNARRDTTAFHKVRARLQRIAPAPRIARR
jgi:predicted Zn-dependent protease